MIERDDETARSELSKETTFTIAIVITVVLAVALYFATGKMNRGTGIMAVGVGMAVAWLAREASKRVRF